jgi:hypothetical protein
MKIQSGPSHSEILNLRIYFNSQGISYEIHIYIMRQVNDSIEELRKFCNRKELFESRMIEIFLKSKFVNSYNVLIHLIKLWNVWRKHFLVLSRRSLTKSACYYCVIYVALLCLTLNDAIYLAHSRQTLVRLSSGTIHLARIQFHPPYDQDESIYLAQPWLLFADQKMST